MGFRFVGRLFTRTARPTPVLPSLFGHTQKSAPEEQSTHGKSGRETLLPGRSHSSTMASFSSLVTLLRLASSLGIWLYRELHLAVVPIIVVEARHTRVSLSTMRNKTDRNDACGIAQMIRLGWYLAVHVTNIDMQRMRSRLSNRNLLKRKLIDIENHIRGTLRAYNLLMGTVGRGSYETRVREFLEYSDPIFSVMIEAMLDVRHLQRLRKIASRASSGGSA